MTQERSCGRILAAFVRSKVCGEPLMVVKPGVALRKANI